jgi:hypothetical protein
MKLPAPVAGRVLGVCRWARPRRLSLGASSASVAGRVLGACFPRLSSLPRLLSRSNFLSALHAALPASSLLPTPVVLLTPPSPNHPSPLASISFSRSLPLPPSPSLAREGPASCHVLSIARDELLATNCLLHWPLPKCLRSFK